MSNCAEIMWTAQFFDPRRSQKLRDFLCYCLMAMTTRIKTLAFILTFWTGAAAATSDVEQYRAEFKEAYALARSGHAHVLKNYQARLNEYTLWPDLVSASYLGRLRKTPDAAIMAHLARYPDTSLNRTLRYRYLKSLARRESWQPFLDLYEASYEGAGNTELDCHARRAQLKLRDDRADVAAALDLWMVGKSQPKACDPLFRELKRRGKLTRERHDERLRLALESGQMKLARFIARNASDKQAAWVDRWQRMRTDPARELQTLHRLRRSDLRESLYVYGMKRLARRDAERARELIAATASDMRIDDAGQKSACEHRRYQADDNHQRQIADARPHSRPALKVGEKREGMIDDLASPRKGFG